MSVDAAVIAEERPRARPSATQGAWTLLFVYGVLVAISSTFALVQGRLFDPGFVDAIGGDSWSHAIALLPSAAKPVAALVRLLGATGLVMSLLVMGVAATAYRSGERWSWYVMWALPLYATFDLATLYAYDAASVMSVTWDVSLLAIALLGLLFPYASFFPDET